MMDKEYNTCIMGIAQWEKARKKEQKKNT
jgi:hypothetical protein